MDRVHGRPAERRIFEAMLVYNLYQTLLNAWCFYRFVQEVRSNGMSIWGNRMVKGEGTSLHVLNKTIPSNTWSSPYLTG